MSCCFDVCDVLQSIYVPQNVDEAKPASANPNLGLQRNSWENKYDRGSFGFLDSQQITPLYYEYGNCSYTISVGTFLFDVTKITF